MRRTATILVAVALLLGSAQQASAAPESEPAARRVSGRVVAVTATEVYVDFGAADGVRPGDALDLSIGREVISLEIVDIAPHSARATLPAGVLPPRVGDAASALVRPPAARPLPKVRAAAPPDAPAVVAARWRGVDLGRPRLIGFRGAGAASGRSAAQSTPAVRGTLAADYLGTYDLRDPAGAYYHRVQVRSSLDVAPPALQWLDYSHRLRLRLDFEPGGPLRFPGSRDALLVYRLRTGLTGGGLRAEIGRTDAAPIPGAGMVDGASVRYQVANGLYVGGFGGASPRLLDLAPTIDGYRFGAYAALRETIGRGRDRWRLSADLGLVGTTFDGAIDRRALGIRTAAANGRAWVTARALLDFYPGDHPAERPSMDLSTATFDVGVRWGQRLRLSGGFDHFRAERTREALAVLPADYLATAGFSSTRGSLSLDLPRGIDLRLRAGYRWQAANVDTVWFGGGVSKRALLLRDDRLWLGGDGFFGGYQDGGSGHIGYALPLHPRVDVDAHYRIAGYRYDDENQHLWRHWVGLGLDAWPRSRVSLQVEVDAHLGDEGRALTSFASAGFRF